MVFALLYAAGNQEVQAQSQAGISLTAHAGYSGYCKAGRWMPVRVEIENKGPDLTTVRVQVSGADGLGGQSAYGAEISLPTTSRKELFLYFPPQGSTKKITVSLLAGDRTLVSSQLRIGCVAQADQLFGLLGDDPGMFADLTATSSLAGAVHVAQLQLADLPDQAQGWESLDALVVSGLDMGGITNAQRTAMRVWLAQGGKLLVTGGPKWQGIAAGLDEFLPLTLTTTRTVGSLAGLPAYFRASPLSPGDTLLVVGQPRLDASVLVEQDTVPVLAQKQIGFGSVYYLAADPTLQPLSGWDGMQLIYNHLLGDRSVRPPWMVSAWDLDYANQALSALPALNLPSAWYIFCLLGVYILIIGPLNYFVLRRLKRQELAWLSIPLLVLLFTAAAYFSGYLIRGTRPILNRLAIAQAWPGVDQAAVHGLVGIYSPGREKYALQAAAPFMPSPFDGDNQVVQSRQDWLVVKQDQNTLLPDVLVESGAVRAVGLHGTITALSFTNQLVIDVSGNDPFLSGTITNGSKYVLKDVVLVTPGDSRALGTLSPGATKQIRLSLSVGPTGPAFYTQSVGGSPSFGPGVRPIDDSAIRRNALLGAALSGASGSSYPYSQQQNRGNWGIYLVGWVDDPLLPASLQGSPSDNIDTTLYAAMLSPTYKFEAGPLKLTPALMIWESSDPEMAPYSTYSQAIPSGGFALSFRPAFPRHYQSVKSLGLDFTGNAYAQRGAAGGIGLSLWNWDAAGWERVPNPVWGRIDVPDPARFVGPGAEIRLRLDSTQAANQAPAEFGSILPTLVVEP